MSELILTTRNNNNTEMQQLANIKTIAIRRFS